METNLTKVTVPASYIDPEQEASFNAVEKNLLRTMNVKGKHDGPAGNPKSVRQHKVQITAPVETEVQSLIEQNHSKHQTVCDVGFVQKLRIDADEQEKGLRNEAKAIDGQLQIAKEEEQQQRCQLPSKWKQRIYYAIAAAFAFLEGILTYIILRQISGGGFVNVLLSLAVMLITGAGLHTGARYILAAPSPQKRKWRYGLVLGLGLVFSILLGAARAKATNEAAALNAQIALEEPSATSSALPYVAISFMAYLVCLALELRYAKTKEEKAREHAYKEKKQEVTTLEAKLHQINATIVALRENVTLKTDWIFRRQVYARDFELRAVALAQKAVSRYEGANLDNRTDGQCPEFFGEKVDFGFRLYFQHILNPQKPEA